MNMNRKVYAICVEVQKDAWENQRFVKFSSDDKELCVHVDSLGITSAGFVAGKFYIEEVKDGFAHGYAQNCEDGRPSGRRSIPIDNIIERSKIKEYDGRLVNISNE